MLKKNHRFHGRNSLRYIYQHSRTIREPLLTLRYGINKRRRGYRVAVVVSKKINKSAVKRNRIRRRLYQFIRLNQSKITKPYDIVINVLDDEIATLPSEQLKNTMKKVFSQTEIFEGTANSGHHGIVSKKDD